MQAKKGFWRRLFAVGAVCILSGTMIVLVCGTPRAAASPDSWWRLHHHGCGDTYCGSGEEPPDMEVGGAWYWLRSPAQEKRVVIGIFNRYCIRCHGVDGRGVWDIPDVPNFTNPRWQTVHTDGQLARSILEGRGSVMPPWRGVVSLEEAWALARYVRTFVPGAEVSRPVDNAEASPGAPSSPAKLPTSK